LSALLSRRPPNVLWWSKLLLLLLWRSERLRPASSLFVTVKRLSIDAQLESAVDLSEETVGVRSNREQMATYMPSVLKLICSQSLLFCL
jgi:hypothetical protein